MIYDYNKEFEISMSICVPVGLKLRVKLLDPEEGEPEEVEILGVKLSSYSNLSVRDVEENLKEVDVEEMLQLALKAAKEEASRDDV